MKLPEAHESKIWERHGERLRFELEWKIVRQVLVDLLAAGFILSIDHDGEDEPIVLQQAGMQEMEELFACDEERLYIMQSAHPTEVLGYVYFVYGNDGWDVINDYSTNLEQYLENANKIAERYGS